MNELQPQGKRHWSYVYYNPFTPFAEIAFSAVPIWYWGKKK